MEQQKFEELEGVDQEEGYTPEEEPKMKEYEKLLLAESNRQLVVKAKNLVHFGCFEQVEVPTLDFSKLTLIESEKKFKGLYDLYQNVETLELVYVCPLVENNVGDEKEERTDLAPYAYDLIVTEAMDEETYQMVLAAGKNNIRTGVSVLYHLAFITYIVICLVGLYTWTYYLFYTMDKSSDTTFWAALAYTNIYSAPFMAGEIAGLPLLVLMSIKYKKYKDQ